MKIIGFHVVLFIVILPFFSKANNFKCAAGADSVDCVKYLSLYIEHFRVGEYEKAYLPWINAFSACSKHKKSFYKNGKKIIRYKVKKEDNNINRNKLLDEILLIIDKREKDLGEDREFEKLRKKIQKLR